MLRDYSLEQKDAQALRKAAKSLAQDFERLLKLYEKQDISNADLREKVKRLRQEKEAKDKQVDLAHRTIERLTVGKGEVEEKDAAKESYIKHLEAKMASLKSVKEVENARDALETRVLLLEHDVRVKDQVAKEAENKAAAVHEELELLKRGIKIAAEQLTTSSGSEVSSEMLLAVARGQEEAASLAQQLADAREQADDVSTALLAARNHLKSQHEALMRWKEWEATEAKQKKEMIMELDEARKRLKEVTDQSLHYNSEYLVTKKRLSDCTAALEMERTARIQAENEARKLLDENKVHQNDVIDDKKRYPLSHKADSQQNIRFQHDIQDEQSPTITNLEHELSTMERTVNDTKNLSNPYATSFPRGNPDRQGNPIVSTQKSPEFVKDKGGRNIVALQAFATQQNASLDKSIRHTLFDLANIDIDSL